MLFFIIRLFFCGFRGNAAFAVQDLREKYKVDIFFVAIDASELGLASLRRLLDDEHSSERLLSFKSAQALLDEGVERMGNALCGYIGGADVESYTEQPSSYKTTKREISPLDFTYVLC